MDLKVTPGTMLARRWHTSDAVHVTLFLVLLFGAWLSVAFTRTIVVDLLVPAAPSQLPARVASDIRTQERLISFLWIDTGLGPWSHRLGSPRFRITNFVQAHGEYVMPGTTKEVRDLRQALVDGYRNAAVRARTLSTLAWVLLFGQMFPRVGYRFRDAVLMYIPLMSPFFVVKTMYRLSSPVRYWDADTTETSDPGPVPVAVP